MTDTTAGSDKVTPCSLQNETGIRSIERNFPGVVYQIQRTNSSATGCIGIGFPTSKEKIKFRDEMTRFSKLMVAPHLVFKYFFLSPVFRIQKTKVGYNGLMVNSGRSSDFSRINSTLTVTGYASPQQ